MELTEPEELELTNKNIKLLTDFLLQVGKDYEIKQWDSGNGRDIIITNDEARILFAFKDNGYFCVEVEKIKEK
jgi:hypothetical protein